MSLRDAAQQALDALELGCTDHEGNPVDLVGPAITALRAALAENAMQRLTDVQQEMERKPVAYVTGYSKGYATVRPVDPCLLMCVGMALYRSPPNQYEEAIEMVEPVAWRYIPSERLRDVVLTSDPSQARLAADYGCEVQPLYPAPPKRKPLTDEEIAVTAAACNSLESEFLADFARAIERAHGIGGEE